MGSEAERPGEGYWQLVEPIWDRISIYDGPDAFLEQFGEVPREIGHLFAVHWCDSEVCNGGFHQFFTNSTGVLAPEAAAGFRAVGLEECATIVEEAMAFFGAPYPRERAVREVRLATIPGDTREEWDPFCELDDRYYQCAQTPDDRLYRTLDAYAAHIRYPLVTWDPSSSRGGGVRRPHGELEGSVEGKERDDDHDV
jgi:hypothetical protein